MLEGFFDTLGCLFALLMWAMLAVMALFFIKVVVMGLWNLLLEVLSHFS